MLCHFLERSVVIAIRYNYHAANHRFKWKQTPYPIYFLRRYISLRSVLHKWKRSIILKKKNECVFNGKHSPYNNNNNNHKHFFCKKKIRCVYLLVKNNHLHFIKNIKRSDLKINLYNNFK